MTDWKPIETAPKDGTEILLCRASDADGNPIPRDRFGVSVQVAAWWGIEPESEEDPSDPVGGEWTVYCSMVQDPRLHFTPTHWAPLPESPLG